MSWERHPIEELFKGCRKLIRVLRVMLREPNVPMSKYLLESKAMVYDVKPLLKRLEKLGIVTVVTGKPVRYKLNRDNPLVKAIENFMKETGYL